MLAAMADGCGELTADCNPPMLAAAESHFGGSVSKKPLRVVGVVDEEWAPNEGDAEAGSWRARGGGGGGGGGEQPT